MTSPRAFLISAAARLLGLFAQRRQPKPRSSERIRILCLTDGGVCEMIDTLPLLYTLRRHFPRALVAVACEEAALPIALSCPAIKVVVLYQRGFLPGIAAIKNGARLQGFDWVVVATPGPSGRLARLSRLTNARVRVGFSRQAKQPSPYLTDSVALPPNSEHEHRIHTLLRLLKPLGLTQTTHWGMEMGLRLSASVQEFVAETLGQRPFILADRYVLVNFSAIRHALREEDIIVMLRRLVTTTNFAIALLAELADQQTSREIAMVLASDRVATLDPIGSLEMAGLIGKAEVLLTGGDVPAHLAAAMDTPAVVLWTRGSFEKTRSQCSRHVFLRATPRQSTFDLGQVWEVLQPFLVLRKSDVDDHWEDLLQLPGDSDLSP